MKNFKYKATLKEFYSKHLHAHHLDSIVNLYYTSVFLFWNPGRQHLWVNEHTINSP